MQRHLLALTVILTVATGCDNVAWGGVEMELSPPPPVAVDSAATVADSEETPAPRVPGPVLLAGTREGARATLTVVGEVLGDAVGPFPNPEYPEDEDRLAELTAQGSEWILFSEGSRVGTLRVDASDLSDELCPPRTTVSGVVELVPTAAAAERLLALPPDAASSLPYEPYEAFSHVYEQRVASLTIAGEVIPRVGAQYPTDGVLAARQDIQVFAPRGLDGQAIAATFVYRDQLAVASPGQGAYALFVLGVPSGDTYREGYAWYRAVDTEGKGAPRYFSHLDWNGDGSAEILLDVFGANRRWYAGLALREGEWVRTFQDTCGSGSSGS